MRLIDADKAKEKLRANAQKDGNPFVGAIVEMFCEFLDQAPTVEDVTPVVHGRWCVGDFGYLNCSVCGKAMYTATKSTKGAAQINIERKHRIMEEKKMYIEADAECPVETEENSLAWGEKALESEVSAEECPGNEEVIDEVALPEEGKCVERVTEPDTPCPVKRGNLAELITAEFWQIYLSHTLRPVNDADVAAMLTLANIAERLAE